LALLARMAVAGPGLDAGFGLGNHRPPRLPTLELCPHPGGR
jgi:hypothetical protein